jgi:FSR family fosmidomycin resistance protein-like MFS transporter
LAAVFVSARGQRSLAVFSVAALAAIAMLVKVCAWYQPRAKARKATIAKSSPGPGRRHVAGVICLLGLLIFCKYFYQASLASYYTFYLIDRFHLTVEQAQLHLFLFLGAIAVGTIAGGPIGDRHGRRFVIRASMLGVIPFALLLPHASLTGTAILSVIIGLILASAFSAILVYAQDLVPGRVGLISGLFFGFAFGMGGLGAALLGKLADLTSIGYVYQVAAYFPLLGLLALALPPVAAKRNS